VKKSITQTMCSADIGKVPIVNLDSIDDDPGITATGLDKLAEEADKIGATRSQQEDWRIRLAKAVSRGRGITLSRAETRLVYQELSGSGDPVEEGCFQDEGEHGQ
jgi:hypothetical protein